MVSRTRADSEIEMTKMLKAVNHGAESSDEDQDLDQSFHSSQEEDLKKKKEKKSKKSDKKDKKQKKDKKSKKRARESSSEAEEDTGFKITAPKS